MCVSSFVCALMLIPRSAMDWSLICDEEIFYSYSWADPEGGSGSGPLENQKWLKVSLEFLVRTSLEG